MPQSSHQGALGTLGTAQTETFARLDAQIVMLGLPGESRAEEVARAFGIAAHYIGQDLGDLKASEERVRDLSASLGGIDVLVSNAALIINKPFEEFSIEEYEDQLRVNAAATFALVRAVAPEMKRKRDGRIVNFCSVTLNGRWDGYVPYVASKGPCLA